MSATDLARLRALAAASALDAAPLERAAALIGRVPRRAGHLTVLARHEEAPAAADLDVAAWTLPDSALVALGLCVGLAWTDRDDHPYPGRPFTIEDVTTAARAVGITLAATRHVVGAIRHVLAQARLVDVDETGLLRLGPAIAAWSDADLEAFRRNLDALPGPIGASA